MEEIVYDTNELIEAAKKKNLQLTGFTTILNVVEFPKAIEFENLTVLYPNHEDYRESLELAIDLLQKRTPLPAADILIAAMCIKRNIIFATRDNHFNAIKSVRKSFKLELTK